MLRIHPQTPLRDQKSTVFDMPSNSIFDIGRLIATIMSRVWRPSGHHVTQHFKGNLSTQTESGLAKDLVPYLAKFLTATMAAAPTAYPPSNVLQLPLWPAASATKS
jgi:hypothetical protein